jgi:ATP phosphoribosyltransferase
MSGPLIIALPSKGRLKEQVEAWLSDCGIDLAVSGGARGYLASLKGCPGAQSGCCRPPTSPRRWMPARSTSGSPARTCCARPAPTSTVRVLLLRALGFGRADLVVAAPRSWLDVETMEDLEEVAHDYLARTGRRMRVATKYLAQTRAFFARHGVVDYRITESGGATEGAPAAGAAELVVDITTTGATLQANGLKTLSDGVILRARRSSPPA